MSGINRPPNPVKKNMDKFHKPSTHKDKTKYDRKAEEAEIERMIDEGAPAHIDYRDMIQVQRRLTDLNWDGE